MVDGRVARLGDTTIDLAPDPASHVDPSVEFRATDAAGRLAQWGFLAHPDLPDGPGPAFLLIALRPIPTLQHYDPEGVDYWVTTGGRGERRTLTNVTPMPRSEDFSWGMIRLVDRLGVSNEYLTFGGHLDAAAVGDVVIAAFASGAPLLRRGGHSQGWDVGADAIGAFFGRLMVAVDYVPAFEATLAAADPLVRYAAFVGDAEGRSRAASSAPREEFDALLRREGARLRADEPDAWSAGRALLEFGATY
ncbi:MAG: hypothetical protein ACJ77F_10600 [Chloroflexota bacterium]